MTACRFPVTPWPSFSKTFDTRATYCGLGLLVTRCWISCWRTNGAMLGCAISASISESRSCSAVWPAGIVMLPKIVFALVSCSDSTANIWPMKYSGLLIFGVTPGAVG